MKLPSCLFALSLLLSQGVSQSTDLKPSSLRKAEVVANVEKQGHDLSLLSKTVDVSHSNRNLQAIAGGETLTPGDYTSEIALSLSGVIHLDPQNDPNAEWTFTITGAFTTAAACMVIFTDDAVGNPANVHWKINVGAASLGAGSYVVGSMDVDAAVTLGAGGTIGGAVTSGGAVTVAADSDILGQIEAGGAVTVGAGCNILGQIVAVGAVAIGATTFVDGGITSDAAIAIGADAVIHGSLLSTTNAAIALGAGAIVQLPTSGPTSNPTETPTEAPVEPPTPAVTSAPVTPSNTSGASGDPHFKTWKGEHFEYHGQCDMILTKDDKFADGLGLEMQIRTKLVRFWSYIKSAAIRIGDDILEIEGSMNAAETNNHYWINFQYQGKLTTLGGFPVTYHHNSKYQRWFEIDLSSKYPGQKIVIASYQDFVRVNFENSNDASFGNTVGMLGDFRTGTTLARDGATELSDFSMFGNEWQILPHEVMLFHDISKPQFPEKCIEPEDPRGDRRRRLDESSITEEQAETACAPIADPLDRKDCVYDILATQNIGMVGAY